MLITAVLLLVSFIEGAAVMVIELLGARYIAPYYGTSLYVWSAVLGVTISALAIGYFSGGFISRRYSAERSLAAMLLAGGLCTLLAPALAAWSWPATELLGVRAGSLTAACIFLLPPIACMGAVSPLIVQLIARYGIGVGRSAGTVYAVSTTGGVLATAAAAFYLLPGIGLRLTATATGALLAGVGIVIFAWAGRLPAGAAGVPPPVESAEPKAARKKPAKPAVAASRMLPVRVLLAVAFIEGGGVMAMELLGAKITAPYYGASLYVWAAVLSVTLAALALGYFAGGWLSRRYPGDAPVFSALLLAGFLTASAPLLAPPVLLATDSLGVIRGSLVSVLVYLLPPVACMGAVSPLITQRISRHADDAGRSTGSVYAIATVGGILATFLTGFYLIPEIGIRVTALLVGATLGCVAVAYFLYSAKPMQVGIATAMAAVVSLAQPADDPRGTARVLYNSSGILGQWTVIDYGRQNEGGELSVDRRLLLNGIDQTYTQVGFEPLSLWKYPHQIAAYASMKPPGSRALLLGMGGGSIAYELKAMKLELDIVELDARIRDITQDYFRYDPTTSVLHIDDARHFIRTVNRKYDVVIIDLLIGEVQPTHMFSMEGFADLRRVLKDDGLVIINFQGFMGGGPDSLGPRSVFKTLREAGYFVEYYADEDAVSEGGTGDIFFLASLRRQDYRALMKDLRYNRWFAYEKFEYANLVRSAELELDDAYVLVDDKPRLELLNARQILSWRRDKAREHMQGLLSEGLPIYR